ncbi:Xaa-Pro aminopeptidase [Pseudohyphozyma bogoriensis]|nr:Xaa-Pro aminopeptidase [Pseudohyphozyma bogoriensis]
MPPVNTSHRLARLRELMKKEGVQAYLVGSDDAHSSEYVHPSDERRAYISGFTGSAGTAIVTLDKAHLFTDGRYHQQAEKELCGDWTLHKYGLPDVKSYSSFLPTLPTPCKIGLDPTLLPISEYTAILPTLPSTTSFSPIPTNLVDIVWSEEGTKPKAAKGSVWVLDERYTGRSVGAKLESVRGELRKDASGEGKKVGLVVSMLDEVSWLLNLRGTSFIPYNPVFPAYLYVPTSASSKPTLFIDIDVLTDEAYAGLEKEGVLIEPYGDVVAFLNGIGEGLGKDEKVVVPNKTSLALTQAIGIDQSLVQRGPVGDLKAIKNSVEIDGFRSAHLKDGVALSRYFAWLEGVLQDGGKEMKEHDAALMLEELRQQQTNYVGPSFTTISSTGANASVIHYHPSETESSVIKRDEVYLCDAGAQFLEGTTDTTRTWWFGKEGEEPSEEVKRAYTRVLQGHIAIDTAVFPSTTTGYLLDAFARKPLWEDGLDYRHGTGHGVGCFLNVHEGPQGIGTRIAYNDIKLKPGMTVSNEPGFYEEGEFGIRIENVVVVEERKLRNDFGGVGWLGFERVTMVPITTRLVDVALLSVKEREWINAYNKEVEEAIGGLVEESGDTRAREWLRRECRAI